MPVSSQRRARGLTRDEVAELAGVSTGWYAQLELGRPINISAKSLEAIASALNLDRYETEYLFSITGTARPATSNGATFSNTRSGRRSSRPGFLRRFLAALMRALSAPAF